MKKLLPLLLLFTFIFVIPLPVLAVDYGGLGGKPANPDPNNPRTKSIFIFEIEPGKEKENSVLVVNNTPSTKTVMVYGTDSQRSSDGSFACEQYADPKDNVGSWITMEKQELTVASGANAEVKFKIKAPLNASVGEENGCILIQEKKAQDPNASGVTLSFRTGLRVVVTIPGEQVRKLDIAEFNAEYKNIDRKDENGNVSQIPLVLSNLTLHNEGNVSIDAKVNLVMKSLFGYSYYTTNNQYPVLRADTATINFEIPKPLWGGIFTVYADVDYDPSAAASVGVDSTGDNTVLNSQRRIVFVFPDLQYLLIELFILLSGIGLAYFVGRNLFFVRKAKQTWTHYKVRPGDNLNSISADFAISWKALVKVNKIKPPYNLISGTDILVPPRKA